MRLVGFGFSPTEDDFKGDIDRLVKSIISPRVDPSNVHLHFDELYGEMMCKIASILSREDIHFPSRAKFFGYLKTALTRHVQTLIQRHVFTQKRSGLKKGAVEDVEVNKTVMSSLDDEESGAANLATTDDCSEDVEVRDLLEKGIADCLTPLEEMVVRQEIEPNSASYAYAYADHGENLGTGKKFKVREIHKARGIGLDEKDYSSVMKRVREKLTPFFYMQTESDNQSVRLAEIQLCQIFNIQVPGHVDPVVKRRCFTLAARDNSHKVTDDVSELLERVGAYIPKKHGDNISCFGVLWEKGHRSCSLCALEESCQHAASQVGTDVIRIDKKLLGTKATKTPMILPKIEPPDSDSAKKSIANLTVITVSERDEDVMSILNESLIPVLHDGEIFYRLPDKSSKRVFCVGMPERVMRLRFCNPSDAVRSELVAQGKGPSWTVPDDMKLEDIRRLMNIHITDHIAK